jgi:hypothetical protein
MSEKIELYPGALVAFYTVYECKKKPGIDEVLKTGKMHVIDQTTANEQKKEFEEKLASSAVWRKDDEGRFQHVKTEDVRWYYVKLRKFYIKL